ncbi:hypothetical protein CSB08_01120 [Candidatus Gracilibacteria bacterium]|nr:MAG: hypothetical protein CSB08_01120 [Candidatus Gracilibacteria bacterium]
MNKFKVAVSKGQKKYTFVVDAENENIVKNKFHKEGYYILSVEEFSNEDILGKKFYFLAKIKGQERRGKVIGKDILKVFIKLKGLGYNIIELFEEGDINISTEEKKQIVNDLEQQYKIHNESKKISEKVIKKAVNSLSDVNLQDFHLKKELESNYHLIDLVLKKLSNILKDKKNYNIDSEKEFKLNEVYNNLLKFKKITNISKLKTIGELALIKIGKIELERLENTKDEKIKNLLKETNKLLKKTGSHTKFVERNKDLKFLFKSLLNKFKKKEVKKEIKKEKEKEVDKTSYSYMKNLLLLSKYKNRLKQNKFGFFKKISLYFYDKKEYEKNVLKIKVIKQNIAILTARQKGYVSSYTKILKSTKTIINNIENFFKEINNFIFTTLFIYIIVFILYINLFSKNINYEGMYLFIMLFILYILISLSKNILLLILNFVFFYFIIIFGSINF